MLCVKCGTKVIQMDNEKSNINIQNKNIEETQRKCLTPKLRQNSPTQVPGTYIKLVLCFLTINHV